jgi:hypothetical protein
MGATVIPPLVGATVFVGGMRQTGVLDRMRDQEKPEFIDMIRPDYPNTSFQRVCEIEADAIEHMSLPRRAIWTAINVAVGKFGLAAEASGVISPRPVRATSHSCNT